MTMRYRLRQARKATLGCLFSCVIGAALAAPNPKGAAPGPKGNEGYQTPAPTAILIEGESGTVLFERNADELVPPASLSKLMTAEVVFHELSQGRLKLEDEFLISTNAWRTGGAPSRTSSMFAPINSRVRIEDLLRGVIVQSGNDACIALAE